MNDAKLSNPETNPLLCLFLSVGESQNFYQNLASTFGVSVSL